MSHFAISIVEDLWFLSKLDEKNEITYHRFVGNVSELAYHNNNNNKKFDLNDPILKDYFENINKP